MSWKFKRACWLREFRAGAGGYDRLLATAYAMKVEWRRVLRFLLAGLANTGFGYACYAVFVLAGAPLALTVAGATALGFLFNFLSYGGFVFGSTSFRRLPRFLLFYLVLGTVNFVLLRALGWIGAGPLVAQAVLLPVLMVCGYLGLQSYVFRGQDPRAAP
ncbi:GtrA family protein [Plastoroseomonas hellenica]|uniref:GtrA family protein n=1 Tax=Plastoroseomonas hellenica TaxID=2687306 RepID=UPI001BA826FB|nr:GtrA family protein [Plastoroseomonas hellenica]MBR0644708.1 GtrA family protein [Plastoroseomonas hellenica]